MYIQTSVRGRLGLRNDRLHGGIINCMRKDSHQELDMLYEAR